MTPKMTKEMTAALAAQAGQPIEVVNPENDQIYYLIDRETHQQAIAALREQRQQADYEAIKEGLAQMERGEGVPIEEAFARIRQRMELEQHQQ